MASVERFLALCDVPGPAAAPLDELCFRLAGCFRPGLDVAVQCRRLDDLAELVPTGSLAEVLGTVYGAAGFRGDARTYYDPANSLLDAVLDRRSGIPLSLAVVLIEVARRVGLDLVGVGMPGHFLVRVARDPALFVDPFTGEVLDPAGCEVLWRTRFGTGERFRAEWLAPTPNTRIVARMVANLENAFQRCNDLAGVATASELHARLPQEGLRARSAAAHQLAAVGRFDRAAAAFELLAAAPGVPQERRRALEAQALTYRARLN